MVVDRPSGAGLGGGGGERIEVLSPRTLASTSVASAPLPRFRVPPVSARCVREETRLKARRARARLEPIGADAIADSALFGGHSRERIGLARQVPVDEGMVPREDTARRRRRFSMPDVALQTAPVFTCTPGRRRERREETLYSDAWRREG